MVAEAGAGLLINMTNYRIMGIVLGGSSLLMIMMTPLFVREKPISEPVSDSMGIFTSIKKTFNNSNFIYYLIPCQTVWFGINTLTISMPYISEVLLDIPSENSGYLIAGAFIVSIAFRNYGRNENCLDFFICY